MVIADVARPTADLGAGVGQAAHAAGPCAALGDPGAIVLAGPPAPAGAESLEQHLTRLGRVPDAGADEVLAAIGASGSRRRAQARNVIRSSSAESPGHMSPGRRNLAGIQPIDVRTKSYR